MDQERARAAALGYADPINLTRDSTTEMYHRCLQSLLLKERAERGRVRVMVASHNEETIRYALALMHESGITPDERMSMCIVLVGRPARLYFFVFGDKPKIR